MTSQHALSLTTLFSWWGLGTGILLLLDLGAFVSLLSPIPLALSRAIYKRTLFFDPRALR